MLNGDHWSWEVGYREQPQMVGQPLSRGKGGLWLWDVQGWGRVGIRCSHSQLLSPAFQFSYTAVFGAYTAFLFIRTGWSSGPHR